MERISVVGDILEVLYLSKKTFKEVVDMKKLLELYQEKLEQRKEKQKQAVKDYIRKARVRRIVEKLLPYKSEVLELVEKYGLDESRRIVNASLSMKLRAPIFEDVVEYLKQPQEPLPKKQKK
ncbi:MAG: hypothetical protein QW607_12610 [Desulfurococcaceae archaeon]